MQVGNTHYGLLVPVVCWDSFWPEDIAPRETISNLARVRRHKLPFPLVKLLKKAVYRCLMVQGVDPGEHIREDVD